MEVSGGLMGFHGDSMGFNHQQLGIPILICRFKASVLHLFRFLLVKTPWLLWMQSQLLVQSR
jgi:hypothetical protein